MTPETCRAILAKPTDPYLQDIVTGLYRIWTPEQITAAFAHYRARVELDRHEKNSASDTQENA
jgi:hypothetical protein